MRLGAAAATAVYISDLDEGSPARQFRLGFDRSGRLLELVVLRFDSGEELVIHAMKARRQYLSAELRGRACTVFITVRASLRQDGSAGTTVEWAARGGEA